MTKPKKRPPTFKTKPCRQCKATFQPTAYGNHFCSIECQLVSHTVAAPNGCIEWRGALLPTGYGFLGGGKTGIVRAHRLSWTLLNGPIPEGLIVRHKCDNRLCVDPNHLQLGTHKDNMRDAVERGRIATGSRLPGTKLTEQQAKEIKDRLKRGERATHLAREFGVHRTCINQIKYGISYKYL